MGYAAYQKIVAMVIFNALPSNIGSMGLVNLPTFNKNQQNVGKYTVPYMDDW